MQLVDNVHLHRIIPAHAGSTAESTKPSIGEPDHPRSRGEHAIEMTGRVVRRGSSPLTRGALRARYVVVLFGRIIPAHAGSTLHGSGAGPEDPDHPRSRGEHARNTGAATHANGSSPLTRGAPRHRRVGNPRLRIIPAHAGSTDASRSMADTTSDHPRSRGEHATRSSLRHGCAWIIPAHAGSTSF